jgi:putative ABC transport system permease protein
MFQHLLTLIWNKKRRQFLLLTELLISFVVLFILGTILSFYYWNYRTPQGLNDQQIWALKLNGGPSFQTKDSLLSYYETVNHGLASIPGIQGMTLSDFFVPYGDAANTVLISYKDKSYAPVNFFVVDDRYATTMGLTILEGRWFTKQDLMGPSKGVVISRTLKEKLFEKTDPIGKIIVGAGQGSSKVVGVAEDVKVGSDYLPAGAGLWAGIDTSDADMVSSIIVKVTPDAHMHTEELIHKQLSRTFPDVEINHMTDMRTEKDKEAFVPVLIFSIIAGFLLINVALGLVGVLWYNIQQRAPEFGLRRAVGATRLSVSMQLWGEALITASFALVIGTFFAIQFPILHVFNLPTPVYILALIFAILFIYVLVTLCALFPGKRAASIYPAVVLHED